MGTLGIEAVPKLQQMVQCLRARHSESAVEMAEKWEHVIALYTSKDRRKRAASDSEFNSESVVEAFADGDIAIPLAPYY